MADRNTRKPQVLDRTEALDGAPKTKPLAAGAKVALHGTIVIDPPAVETQVLNEGSIEHDEIREARALLRAQRQPPTSTRAPFPITGRQVHPLDEVSVDPPPWKEPLPEITPVVNPLLRTAEAVDPRVKPPAAGRSKKKT